MNDSDTLDRRRFLAATAGAGTVLLAGCSGSDGSDDDGSDDSGGDDGGSGGDAAGSVEDWLGDANNYDGVVDETGADAVTVTVGPGGNNSYDPAAVRVSPGTTVTWEWEGPGHDVAVEDAPTDWSGHESLENEGFSYEHTFDEAGEYLYLCTPHEALGMKGAVVVEE